MSIAFWRRADDVLRQRWTHFAAGEWSRAGQLIACTILCGGLYGAVMGTFGGLAGDRSLQVVYSATKVPLLLGATFLLSLPSFFVVQSLLGLRTDLARSIHVLLATQATMAILLASLAGVTAVWYVTTTHYATAVFFNGLIFAVASLGSQRVLRGHYRRLIAADPRHAWSLRAWLVVYLFVGIQMAWTLRPFIGDPGGTVQFFRQDTWGNAYVKLLDLIHVVLQQLLTRGR